jgi:signal transduction histidine kinase
MHPQPHELTVGEDGWADDVLALADRLVAAQSHRELLNIFHGYINELVPHAYVSLWVLDEQRTKRDLLLIDRFESELPITAPGFQRISSNSDFARLVQGQDVTICDLHNQINAQVVLPPSIAAERLAWLMAMPVTTRSSRGALVIGARAGKPLGVVHVPNLRTAATHVLAVMSRLQERDVTTAINQTIGSLTHYPDGRYDLEVYLTNLVKAVKADGACILGKQNTGSGVSFIASSPQSDRDKPSLISNEFLSLLTRRPVRIFSIGAREPDDDLKLYGIDVTDVLDACSWLAPSVQLDDHLLSAPFAPSAAHNDAPFDRGVVIVTRRMTKLPFLRADEDLIASTTGFVNVLTQYQSRLQTQADLLAVAKDVVNADVATVATSALLGAVNLTGAVAGLVALYQEEPRHLQVIEVFGMPQSIDSEMFDMQAPGYQRAVANSSVSVEHSPSRVLVPIAPFTEPGVVEIVVPISRDAGPIGLLVLAVSDRSWSESEHIRQRLALFADQVGIAQSEMLLAKRAARFQDRIEQIASQATASVVAISLAHEVKNAVGVLGLTLENLEPLASSLRAQSLDFRARQKLAERFEALRERGVHELVRVSQLANMVRDLTTDASLVGSATDEVVYLNDVLALWTRLLQDTADQYSVKLVASYDHALDRPKHGDGHPCKANRARLGQVIINLVSNALQASRPGTRVELTSKYVAQGPSRRFARFAVRDYGPGMTPDQIKHAFDMFFSTKPKGYGMGLPIVHKLVEAFGGTVQVTSAPNKGSTFEVSIPCQ